ncbi:hypothetical protein AGABI1DRAFT_77037 [Agaricus bisporus var. burnettii JB137-S8]|uniref:PUM-HD domain-containing protein n=1 Tax=Agaricus bisporus var. burnettii (strain JB137-S8 / ATCC MYA-4627 / FGSC 10392) TaxID=597362 RepID=K5VSV3_AGABU|nr:uncharacterized protein AGABI1DRAFT_77037 [Agaricus bisporus var. burnettii JB137-S8]EKM77539.1 hypothetical protein AGABI1DRAFT_77037 [Agaricus bisporus var. burnettii JB137-S8]
MVAQKNNKKRSAPTKLESKAKRRNDETEILEKTVEKKRSRPVTHTFPIVEESDSEDVGEDEDADIAMEDEPLIDQDAMEVEGETNVPKDPNAARESHKAQKVLHEQRKAAKPHSTLLTDAKRVWSLARQQNIPSAQRQKHIADLMDVIRGKVKEIVLKHDASRIVQTIIKYGKQKERDEIALELKGKYRDLVQSRYSKFLVSKLIRLCPTHRPWILQEFQSNILRLLLHREASSVLADSFELYANAYERTFLLRDFYGKEAVLFNVTHGSAEDKERDKKGLSGILEGADEGRRNRTLAAVKENLLLVFNNSDKGAVTHAVVHRILWEYLCAISMIDDEAEQEKLRRDVFDSCQESLAEMVHTKDGSRVVREFLVRGSAKDRKQILKVLKPHIERMCLDDEAQLVLFTALDVIDDTKLLSKSLISEITTPANNIYEKPQGFRALVYLLAPRTRRHFMPAQIASLEETDAVRARTSKKDPEARADEIRKFASEALLNWITENGAKVAREPRGSLIVTEIMLYAEGDKTSATKTLVEALAVPYPSLDASTLHPVDLSWTSRMYKTLLQGGHFNRKTQSVDTTEHWNASHFASSIIDTAPRDIVIAMCTEGERNGTFLLVTLCEALLKQEDEKKVEREKLKGYFGENEWERVRSGVGKGKDLLLEKLALL